MALIWWRDEGFWLIWTCKADALRQREQQTCAQSVSAMAVRHFSHPRTSTYSQRAQPFQTIRSPSSRAPPEALTHPNSKRKLNQESRLVGKAQYEALQQPQNVVSIREPQLPHSNSASKDSAGTSSKLTKRVSLGVAGLGACTG